jgi:hypothetical protein
LAYGWTSLLPHQELFVQYATWLFLTGYAYSTICSYISSLPSLYIGIGVEISMAAANFPALACCLKGIRRNLQAPKPKIHFTIANLVTFRSFINLYSPHNLACWAALCVDFFSFLRSGNLVPKLKGE